MPNETRASWIFGSVFAVVLILTFALAPDSLPQWKLSLLGYFCATLAGFFGLFFTGRLILDANLPMPGKWVIKAGGAFALFLIVLFWWRSDSGPGGIQSPAHNSQEQTVSPTQSRQNRVGTQTNPQPQTSSPELQPVGAGTHAGATSAPSSAATLLPADSANPSPVLTEVTVKFITGDDDKDHDTSIAISLIKGEIPIATADHLGMGVHFNDYSEHGPYPLQVVRPIERAAWDGVVTRISIQTNGNDTWKSRAVVTATFSAGPPQVQTINFALSEHHREQAWDWGNQ